MKNSITIASVNILLNLTLFLIMIISIQNSNVKKTIDFNSFKTIPLPISFIVGTSFILGSLNGGLIATHFKKNNH